MTKSINRSFAGGEITPEMYGRTELGKYQTGLALCRNFTTLPHGPAARRPRFTFTNEAKDSTRRVRLLPFTFSASQAVMLEFGHLYIRMHTSAGTVLETAKVITAATQASPGVFTSAAHGYTTGDWLYLSGVLGMTSLNGRFVKVLVIDANTFSLTDLAGVAISTAAYPAFVSGNVARVYTLTTTYTESQIFDIKFAQDSDVLTLTHPDVQAAELVRLGATNWTLTGISFAPTLVAPTGLAVAATIGTASTAQTDSFYVVTTVGPDLVTESLASTSVSANNNLTLAGNFNTISFTAPLAGSRVYVYKKRGGVFGYIGQSTTTSLIDDNIQADTTLTPPESVITLNSALYLDFPQTVTHHERRRWFAGTHAKPQTIWATRNATLSNLQSSIPSRDDDGMEFRIAAVQQNAIRHIVPLNDLIALTVNGEFRIFADGGPAITPTTISIKPQGFGGASNVAPALTESSVLYVQAQGSRVRELTYSPSGTGSLVTVDATIMSPHLVDGHTLTQLAYTRAPDAVLWAVRDDGKLIAMSYVPSQQVYGWHQHDTQGVFESVATISENNADVLWAVVRRTINGRTVRYIEHMEQRLFSSQADAKFGDSGATYSGALTTHVSGIYHLEGCAVNCLADGAVVEGLTVTGGAITLDIPASTVQVGLDYTSDLMTLPISYMNAPADGRGTQKNVNSVYIRVKQSSLVQAGPNFDNLTEFPARDVSDHYDSPPALRSREIAMDIDPDWNSDGSVCIRQTGPLPLTVVSLVLDTAIGGG